MIPACEKECRPQFISGRGLVSDNPRRDHIAYRDARSGIKYVVQPVTPGASVDRRCTQGAVFQVSYAYHQTGVERVLKPDSMDEIPRMAEVAATVDNELGESALAEDISETMSTRSPFPAAPTSITSGHRVTINVPSRRISFDQVALSRACA